MTQVTDERDIDRALKARHRAMWALGDYDAVSTQIIPELGRLLVEAVSIGPGQRVVDVAAGSGNASIPAARAGAQVVATDLTPELLEIGRLRAAGLGLDLRWQEADAEALPFGDGEFDAVISCVGVMFAPHHTASAGELVRVARPGARIGLVAWTPEGFIGQLFAAMRPYAAPPPPGAQPPPWWGREDHVRELFGDRVDDLTFEHRVLAVDHFAHPEDFRDYFRKNYGPTIAAYRGIADDQERTAALDRDLVDLARRHLTASGMGWEYLLVTARRA